MAGRSGFDYRQPTGHKTLRITRITSGAGSFVPLRPGVRARVVLQAGGGGGGYVNGGPGGGGAGGGYLDADILLLGPMPYIVGAGGSGATVVDSIGSAGSNTSFGALLVSGGGGGQPGASRSSGGAAGQSSVGAGLAGGAGGAGVSNALSTKGYLPGQAVEDPRCVLLLAGTTFYYYGCGGSSVMGQGGDANSVNGTGYGAGGRGGMYAISGVAAGAGSPGIIIVEEYE